MNDLPSDILAAKATELPYVDPTELQSMSVAQLLDWMRVHEDLVPRAVIDECVRRGEPMVEALRDLIFDDGSWEAEDYLLLHAVHILGLLESEAAGEAIVEAMRRSDEYEHYTLLDEMGGWWPALFRNKPPRVFKALEQLATGRDAGSTARSEAAQALLYQARRESSELREARLDQLASWAADGTDDLLMRVLLADALLDFCRPRHRQLLEQLGDEQGHINHFDREDVAERYAESANAPDPEDHNDPWSFYDDDLMLERMHDRLHDRARHPLVPELPDVSPAALGAMSNHELVALLGTHRDRIPRTVIDECASRADAMVELLRPVIRNPELWSIDETTAESWLLVHAVNILGLLSSDVAGELLLEALRHTYHDDEATLVVAHSTPHWVQLFRNKQDVLLAGVRELLHDQAAAPFSRTMAACVLLERAGRTAGDELEQCIDEIAAIASQGSETLVARASVAGILTCFPRARHREILLKLAHQQARGPFKLFTRQTVEAAFGKPPSEPPEDWYSNPWEIYEPEAEEELTGDDAEDEPMLDRPRWNTQVTYVREAPKVGRNDPCPCGSGKKYKKCCLA